MFIRFIIHFLQVMDELFCKKAWCSPVAVASSPGMSVKKEQTVSDRSNSQGEKRKPF